LKDRDYLILASKDFANTATDSDNDTTIPKGTTKLASPIALTFESVDEVQAINPETIYVDADVLKYPLKIRKWEEGDIFYPFGMTGKKKLSKYFKDEKLSLLEKQKTRLLLSADKIIWVVGMRADNRFKVTPETKNILKIQLQK